MPLQACSATEPRSIGWIPPRDDGTLVCAVNHQLLLTLGIEEKLLPVSIVKRFASDKAKEIEDTEGRRVGRREMREMIEEMTIQLLPRAFTRQRRTFGWIDRANGWLVIDAASPAKAEEFIEHLRESLESLPVKVLKVTQSPSAAMTGWVDSGEAPVGFTVDQDLELRSTEKATVRYANHSLEGEEIRQHIADGKIVTRLAMTWNDRISFILNDVLQIKRLTFLDILKEQSESQSDNADERFDIDFTLMTGEVAHLLDDLIDALGGEVAPTT
jgi:recombination associated protein RdgC